MRKSYKHNRISITNNFKIPLRYKNSTIHVVTDMFFVQN